MHRSPVHPDPLPNVAPVMLDLLPAQAALVDADGVILYANQPWRDFSAQEAVFAPASAYLDGWCEQAGPRVWQEVKARFDAAQPGHADCPPLQATCRGRSGDLRLEIQFRALVIEEVPYTVVTHADISLRSGPGPIGHEDSRAVHGALREGTGTGRCSGDFFRNAFQSSYIGTAILELDGRIHQVNSSFCDLLGYHENELLSLHLRSITHPDDLALSERMMHRLTQLEIPRYQIVQRYRHRQGPPVWVLLSSSLLRDPDGQPQHVIAQVQDISEHKRAEEELRRQALTFENISDGVVFTRQNGSILDWNPAAERMLGYSRNEVLERNFEGLLASTQAGLMRHIQDVLTRLRRWQGELLLQRKDGGECVSEAVVAPLLNEYGQPAASVFILHDVTESRHLEEQLRQSQKMEAVGRLAGGVAHDFNNLLTVVKGYSELLLADLPQESAQFTRVHEIRRAADRAADLTRQLLAYSRRQVLAPRLLDLNVVVANLAPMLRRLIGEDIDLTTSLSSFPLPVKADPGQIDQVILNLVVNARDAIPQSGAIEIQLTTQSEWAQPVYGGKMLPPGSYAVLSVRDTGVGMDRYTQEHLFEPFFTTKEQGKGTGLGLAMVYGIVRQSGGHILVHSIPGKGSCFIVYLPRTQPQEEDFSLAPPARQIEPGRETILVVEDEDGVRALLCDLLVNHGYRVLDASNGEVALRHAAQLPDPIDLMITDVVMPRMGGRELAERMASLRPRMKVLYISGYTNDEVVRHGVRESQMAFLQKPFTPSQLQHKVRDLLNDPDYPFPEIQ